MYVSSSGLRTLKLYSFFVGGKKGSPSCCVIDTRDEHCRMATKVVKNNGHATAEGAPSNNIVYLGQVLAVTGERS